MRRCDTQQLTEESIMELIRQRGNLKFSTLMVFFHISSVEALAIVEEYQKKGILDAKGKYVPEGESGAAVPRCLPAEHLLPQEAESRSAAARRAGSVPPHRRGGLPEQMMQAQYHQTGYMQGGRE